MARQKSLFTILLVVVGILLAGCQSTGDKKKEDAMKATLDSYRQTLRWQNSMGIENYFKDPEMGRRSLNPGYDVASYDVVSGPNYVDENHIQQTVAIGFVRENTQSYSKVMDNQTWEATNEGKTWLRTNQGPKAGK